MGKRKSTKSRSFRELKILEKIAVIFIFFVGPLTILIIGILAATGVFKKKRRQKLLLLLQQLQQQQKNKQKKNG